MKEYRDNYYGSILDPLHGDIKLSEIEKWCLGQPLFSRLRYVKQNTFLYYIFPSANHTRFEHSIGVMHMASKIFDSCKENYATGQRKKEKYNITGKSFFDIRTLGVNEPVYFQELRLAALFHDIGHGPMSHLFDEFAISKSVFLRLISETSVLRKYESGFEAMIAKEKNVAHETLSCAFIFFLIDKLKTTANKDTHKFSDSANQVIQQLSAERIVKMLEPDFGGLKDGLLDSVGNDYTGFFSKIITAFPIDADRMDYLIRDSYFSGVTYGIYDLNRIYSSFQAKCENNQVDLVYKESGSDSMLRFIQSRSHLYNQVYFHKTNRAVNTMLTYATKSIREADHKLLDSSKTFEELVDFYVANSDEYFIKSTIKNKELLPNEVSVLKELIRRKLFKRVYGKKIILTGLKDKVKEKQKELKAIKGNIEAKLQELKHQGIYAAVDYYENDTFKDAGNKSVSLAKKEGKYYVFLQDWKQVGKDFDMSDMVVCTIRIYIRRTFHNSAEFDSFSNCVRNAVSEEINIIEAYRD